MYYFIVNPNARGGNGIKIWNKLEKYLKHLGTAYEAYLTEKPMDASRYAAQLTEGCREPRIIVAVGGDGTVNEILDGISFCGPVTLGYIPAGSGNDLARSLKLPKSPIRCMKKILNPRYYKLLDYGVVSYGDEMEHRRFVVSAGIGLDAAVCHNMLCSRFKKTLNIMHLGKMSYIFYGLKQVFCSWPFKGYLILDGVQKVEFNHIYFIAVHVHPFEGGGFKFAPGADPCDGKLTLCVVHHGSKAKLIPILLGALLGHHKKFRGVRNYTCREVEIHTERPVPAHADGESCKCQQNIQIRCIQGKIRMIV